MRKLERYYRSLHQGFMRQVPYGLQKPNVEGVSPFTDVRNLVFRDGAARAAWDWNYVTLPSGAPMHTIDYSPDAGSLSETYFARAESSAQSGQRPLYIFAGSVSPYSDNKRLVVVTDAGVYVNGVCLNETVSLSGVTPQNADSSFERASGDPWSDIGVKRGDLIEFESDGVWRNIFYFSTIASVENAWIGAGSGYSAGPYDVTVRRMWLRRSSPTGGLHSQSPDGAPNLGWNFPRTNVFCTVSNDDLYIAGEVGGLDWTAAAEDQNAWAVLRVAGIFSSGGTEAYPVLTGFNYKGWSAGDKRLLVDGSGNPLISSISGIVAPSDGRLLVLGTDNGGSMNRIYFSAHIGDSTYESFEWWTESPAGYNDIPYFLGAGQAFALMGDTPVAFFADGMVIGRPTGQQESPYSWWPIYTVGTVYPRSIRSTPYGLVYLGTDNEVRLFNGEQSIKLTESDLREWVYGLNMTYRV